MAERLVISKHHDTAISWPSASITLRWPSWRSLRVDQASGCPFAFVGTKRYWHVRWSGLRVGAWSHVECEVENRGIETVHSYAVRFVARDRRYSSGSGMQPEGGGVPPGGRFSQSTQSPPSGCVAVRIDFVQFAGGDVWYSTDEDALVTEAGIRAGAQAAAAHLLNVLERSDAATVISNLPGLRADMVLHPTDPKHGFFGFYSGVTNLTVRLQNAYDREGLSSVERLLRSMRG